MLLENILKHIETLKTLTSEDKSIQKMVFSNTSLPGKFETCSFLRNNNSICDICFSVMAGCDMKCPICATTYSSALYSRTLKAEEMLAQIYIALQKRLIDLTETTKVTITFMGNGEPFCNFNNVIKTITEIDKLVTHPIRGYNISTIGINLNRLNELATLVIDRNKKIKIQYSLMSPDNKIRKKLIPKGMPMSLAIPKLDNYAKTTGIPVKYNVPLIRDLNNTKNHLNDLASFILEAPSLRTLKLSYYNSFPGNPFIGCSDEEISNAALYVATLGITPKVFFGDRNDKIFATCGLMRLVYGEPEQP